MLGSGSQVGSCVRMCAVSVVRRVNVFSHSGSSHLYGLLPVCVRRCRARELESLNVLAHPGYSQQCGFSPVCTRMCTCNADLCPSINQRYIISSDLNHSWDEGGKRTWMNVLPQFSCEQTNGLSPVCIL